MKKNLDCSVEVSKTKTICDGVKDYQTIQPFPSSGPLVGKIGLRLRSLKTEIRGAAGKAYSYVVTTVGINKETLSFEQRGSAPNFQGGVLTLCTCKHQMRATQSVDAWPGTWIADFTTRTSYDSRHWLVYLAKIESAHESHADLWKAMKTVVRKAKAADKHFFGDVYRPTSPLPTGSNRYLSQCYIKPLTHVHRQYRGDNRWKYDINYYLAEKYRHPALIVSCTKHTFLWDEPVIYFAGDHCRNFAKWSSISDLVAKLRMAT